MFFYLWMYLPLSILCKGLLPLIFFAITYTQEDGHFTTLGKAAMVCYILGWSALSFILFPVSAILVIIDRIHRNELDAVTIAFVATTFGGLLPEFLLPFLWDFALQDGAYKAWLATFDEDWDTNCKYKYWWWMFRLDKKLAVYISHEANLNGTNLIW